MSQSGDGDWLITPVVSEMKSLGQKKAQVQELITIFRIEEDFLFGWYLPAK